MLRSFQSIAEISSVAYKLQLSTVSVFHLSQLKKVIGEHEVISKLPKEMAVQDELLEPEEILKIQEVLIDGNKVSQVLVK